MLIGNKVILKSLEKDDLEQLRKWRNIEEFKKHFREYREITQDMQEKWYASLAGDKSTLMFAIRDRESDELLGCCGLCYVNWVYKNADLSIYIGKNNLYIDDCYAKEACELLFSYAFQQLDLTKVWTEIYCFDTKKYDLYVGKLHFHVDGELRKQYFYDGEWHNSYILSLLDDDYRKFFEKR